MSSPPRNTRLSGRRLWLAGTAFTALAAVAAATVGLNNHEAQAATDTAPAAVQVSVATVESREVATWDEFSGRLEAVQRVDIRSRVAGTVQAVHFREGALVRQGELLLTIDPAPYAADAERAAAQVAAAQARVAFAHSEFDRAQRLLDERAIAQREYDERANARNEADANLRAAQAALQSARLALGYTEVRAPVAGRVGRLEVTVGNLVASGPGASVLTTLVSVSPIYASFDADEQAVVRALQGLGPASSARATLERVPVRMATGDGTADNNREHAGHLQLVDNQVDAKSGTVRVRAVFDNADGQLMPGQFARVRMGQTRPTPALLVSERAVGTDQNKKYVMVVGADNKAEWREVTLGASVDGLRIVTAGLTANERIVVNGLQRVRPGTLVAPQAVAMNPPASPAEAAAEQPRWGSRS